MGRVLTLLIPIFIMYSCSAPGKVSTVDNKNNKVTIDPPVPLVNVRVYNNDTIHNKLKYSGYGYDIYINNALYIHQPYMPSVQGNNGFTTEAKAKRTGEFVAYKISNKIIPPSVSPAELDSIGVLR